MYFWNCCFEEIVAAKKPVGFKLLNYKFALRLASLKRQLTRGHENWFQHNNNNLLLQLFTAANLQIAPDSTYSHTLSCYSNARRVIVLEKLTKWLHENTAGLREHDEERALLAAIEFIQSSHPDWPRLGDVVAVHCFTTQIVTKERFSTEWTRTRSSMQSVNKMRTADWFERYWCCLIKGRWLLAHCCITITCNNQGGYATTPWQSQMCQALNRPDCSGNSAANLDSGLLVWTIEAHPQIINDELVGEVEKATEVYARYFVNDDLPDPAPDGLPWSLEAALGCFESFYILEALPHRWIHWQCHLFKHNSPKYFKFASCVHCILARILCNTVVRAPATSLGVTE